MSRTIANVMPSRRDRGFTLIELLVVIAIAGILAMYAMPSYTLFVAAQRIKSASFDVMVMFTLARSEAIKRNAQVTATPVNNDWSKGWTVTAADGTVLSSQSALPGIALTCMQGGPPLVAAACSSLTYNASGRITGGVQSIQIRGLGNAISQDGEKVYARCISMDLGGRPNSKKGMC